MLSAPVTGTLADSNLGWSHSTSYSFWPRIKGLTALETQPTLGIEKIYDWQDRVNFWNKSRNKPVNKSAFAASAATQILRMTQPGVLAVGRS